MVPTWEPKVYHGKELPVPKVGTHGCQRGTTGYHCRTAGSQRLNSWFPSLGTMGYHYKELPVSRGWNSWFPTWEPWVTIASNCRFPEVGTRWFPTWETWVTIASNCRLLEVGIDGSQRGNQRLPMAKELPVPRR